MSMSLVVLLPLILLGIVGTLCFVGCAFDSSGIQGPPFTTYTGTDILLNPAIIAYWPLGEAKDTDKAAELISGNTGNYIDLNTTPSLYPWPAYSVQNPPGPDVQSAAGAGTIAFTQPGLVKGDAVQPGNDAAIIMPCVKVDGGYVEVPFNVKFVPQASFTVEAWVRVDWTASDPHAWRFVLDMRDFSPVTTGLAIYARADDNLPGSYRWGVIVGDGSAGFQTLDSNELTLTLKDPAAAAGTTFYVAVTYEVATQTLTLFVNDSQQGQLTPVAYVPNTTQPLWIGAGSPFVARRPQPAGTLGSPLFPFVGAIQDVAIYGAALLPDVIFTHFNNGNGNSGSVSGGGSGGS